MALHTQGQFCMVGSGGEGGLAQTLGTDCTVGSQADEWRMDRWICLLASILPETGVHPGRSSEWKTTYWRFLLYPLSIWLSVPVAVSTQGFFLLLVGDYWVIVSGAEGQRALGKGKDTKVPEPLPAPPKWG